MARVRYPQITGYGVLDDRPNSSDWSGFLSSMRRCFEDIEKPITHLGARTSRTFSSDRILLYSRNEKRLTDAIMSGEDFEYLELLYYRQVVSTPNSLDVDHALTITRTHDLANEWYFAATFRCDSERLKAGELQAAIECFSQQLPLVCSVMIDAEWHVPLSWWFADISCGAGPKLKLLTYTGDSESFYSRNVQRLIARQRYE